MTASITPSPEMVERQAAFLVALAQLDVPPDVQEILVHGNAKMGVPPNALARALTAALSCPDGFRLVPVEPTIEMMGAVGDAVEQYIAKMAAAGGEVEAIDYALRAVIYRAMLAASPAPAPQPISQDQDRG